jgi:alkylation response protein AidB-like acyl-CoA dehydrogenase
MDFSYTETQTMVRDTLARFLSDRYGHETRMKIARSEAGWSPDIWRAFAEELGILAAPFSEAHGGLGGGAVENMIVMEELGRALVLEPYLSTVVIGGGFARELGRDDLIAGIIGGAVTTAFAWAEPKGRYDLANVETTAKRDGDGWVLNGHKAVVRDAPFASHLIVTARTAGGRREQQGLSLFLIENGAPGVVRRDYPTVDGGRASEVYFENARIGAEALLGEADAAFPVIQKIADEATAALAAEAVGVLRELHRQTQDYAQQRKQFGQPIAKFQVLQHRMVDMFMEAEQAASMALMATLKLPDPAAVSMAKAKIGKALQFSGQAAVQIHGGMGMTDELAVGHYFKRATMIEGQFGSTDHHLQRYEALAFGAAA